MADIEKYLAPNQDREPNFRSDDGRLFLVRCFKCDPERGKENWAMSVAPGVCAWCGWSENESTKENQDA